MTNFKFLATQSFVDNVNAISEGKLELKLFPAGAVVPALKEFDGVHDGIVEFAEIYSPYWLDKLPNAGLFAYTVGGMSGLETYMWMTRGGGQAFLEKMIAPYNIVARSGTYYPPETFLWSNKPLKTLADIKGMKIRTAGDDGEMFKQMGVAVVTMAGGEIYDAMKRGVIDGFQASSPALDITLAVHEVSKYAYLSPVRQPTDYTMLGVNKKAWDALTPGLKKLLEEAYAATGVNTYAKALTEDIKAIETLKKYGTIIEPASKEIEAELIKQAQIFYDGKAAKDTNYAEILKSQRDFASSMRGAFARY